MIAARTLRRIAVLASALPLVSAQAQTNPAPPAAPAAAETGTHLLDYTTDRWERMTVPVNIEGKGPYNFVVDTGAERTVISRELARDLQLGAGRSTMMHSMTEVREVPTVLIPTLEVSNKRVEGINAPALARAHLGAEGMLGVDSLKSQRVLFDFARQTMAITPSRGEERRWAPDTIVITARSRFGHLVLVDAALDGQKVWVVIDTGSQVSIGNSALRRKLERRGKIKLLKPVELVSVTGGTMMANYTSAKLLRIGGVDIKDLPIAFADVHPFRKLKLTGRPALLLGMDALRLFDRVSVDFATRKVRLLPAGLSQADRPTMMASRLTGSGSAELRRLPMGDR